MEARSERPLSGVRILDLTRFLAGPYCTMLLADLGAEVIKIEPPEGDESRHQKAYRYGDETAYYISANRNKRGIVLDLKLPEGRQVFYELVAHADVVVDNYRAQTLRRLGADYEQLRQIKPEIICCSLTAFGDEGAAAARTSCQSCVALCSPASQRCWRYARYGATLLRSPVRRLRSGKPSRANQ